MSGRCVYVGFAVGKMKVRRVDIADQTSLSLAGEQFFYTQSVVFRVSWTQQPVVFIFKCNKLGESLVPVTLADRLIKQPKGFG